MLPYYLPTLSTKPLDSFPFCRKSTDCPLDFTICCQSIEVKSESGVDAGWITETERPATNDACMDIIGRQRYIGL